MTRVETSQRPAITDAFAFAVKGRADGDAAAPPPSRRDEDEGASSLPLLIGLGVVTAVIVGIAFLLRARG